MDDRVKVLQEMKEGGQKLFFGISSVGKPLDQMPKALAVKGAADEIQAGIISGQAGGFDVKKQKLF